MSDPWQTLIGRIHAAPQQAVIVATGGGASAISELLGVPGGSRTLLEAVVPYSAEALTEWLRRRPEQFCVEETALAMAAVADERAKTLSASQRGSRMQEGTAVADELSGLLIGVACTASLVSDRPKKGEHRAYVATQTRGETVTYSLILEKGARQRADEERLVGHLILQALARAAGLDELPALELRTGEQVVTQVATAQPLVIELLEKKRGVVWSLPAPGSLDGLQARPTSRNGGAERDAGTALHAELPFPHSAPAGILCGAFHPLHFGHEQLRIAAERIVGGPVYYEMSIRNVDKPPLDFLSLQRRRAQFTEQPLALTAVATFAEKAVLFKGVTFVVGIDTAERIIEPRYYGGSAGSMESALAQIRDAGCRFLVAGRKKEARFETLRDAKIPGEFAALFAEVRESEFRADVSSTQLRSAEGAKPQA